MSAPLASLVKGLTRADGVKVQRGRSDVAPRTNILITGPSQQAVQRAVFEEMDALGIATFTHPERCADGTWAAFGHAPLGEAMAEAAE